MPIPTLSTAPTAPSRANDTPSEFVTNADAFVEYIAGLDTELNTWAAAVAATVSGVDFNGTSATSLLIGTGTKNFTASTGKLWNVGQYVIAASLATPANYMVGQVTSYTSGNGALEVNVASVGGAGTLADWVISLAPSPGDFITAAGSATLTNKTLAFGSNTVSGTTAQFNLALSDGDFATLAGSETLTNKTIDLTDNTVTGTLAEFNAAVSDADLASLAGSETLTNKTLTDPILTGTARQDIYTITDGAGFAIDPRNGAWQIVVLGANRTPTVANFNNGDMVELWIDDGTAYTIDWSTIAVTWMGDIEPRLRSTGYTKVRLYRIGATYYGEEVSPTPVYTGIVEVGQTSSSGTLSGSATTPTISLTSLTGGIGNRPIESDFVVVAVSASSSGAGSDLDISMVSAGWTEHQDLFANSTSDANVAIYYKKMSSTPDTSFQLSIPASSGHSYAVGVKVFRGVDTTNPLDVTTTTSTGTTTVLVDPPAATLPNTAANLLLLIGGGAHTGGTRTFGASYLSSFLSVGQDNTSGDATVGMGYIKGIFTAYNGAAWTFSTADNAAYSYAAVAMVLRAA